MGANVLPQLIFLGGTVITVGAGKGFFTGVGAEMGYQFVLSGGTIGTVMAGKGFLSSMSANVLNDVVFSISGIFAVWTLVHLADRSSPATLLTVLFHLQGMPNLIIGIFQIQIYNLKLKTKYLFSYYRMHALKITLNLNAQNA